MWSSHKSIHSVDRDGEGYWREKKICVWKCMRCHIHLKPLKPLKFERDEVGNWDLSTIITCCNMYSSKYFCYICMYYIFVHHAFKKNNSTLISAYYTFYHHFSLLIIIGSFFFFHSFSMNKFTSTWLN